MVIAWNDDLITGISTIDEQHLELFNMANSLEKLKGSKEEFYEILMKLQNYILVHLKTEEEYMNFISYPDYENHKIAHKEFVNNYKSIVKRVSEAGGIMNLGPEIVQLIQTWLDEHYNNDDIRLAKFIKENS